MEVQDEWYQGTTMESILCLISHEDQVQSLDSGKAAFISIRMMFFLLTCTNFFGKKLDRDKVYDVDIIRLMSADSDLIFFFGRLIIKLFYITCRNCYSVT